MIKDILRILTCAAFIVLSYPTLQLGPSPSPAQQRKLSRLIQALREPDPDGIAGYLAAVKLGKSAHPLALDVLLSSIKDDDPEVRKYAALGLGYFNDTRATRALIAALRDGMQVREVAARSLRRLRDPHALERLLQLTRDPVAAVRCGGLYGLAAMRDSRAFDAIYAALQDPSSDVRAAAVRAIAGSCDPRTVEVLAAALEHGDWSAGEYLSYLPDDRGFGPLLHALESPNRAARDAASSGLRYKWNPRPANLEPLHAALENESAEVRWRAASVLDTVSDPQAVDILLRMIGDPDHTVRLQAMQELGRIDDTRAHTMILAHAKNASSELHRSATSILCAQRDPQDLNLILNLLKDKVEAIRWTAAEALGAIGDPRAIDPLVATAFSKNPDYIRKRAVQAISQIHDARAVEALNELVKAQGADAGPLRSEASAALARLQGETEAETWRFPNDPGAIDRIIGTLNSTDSFTRPSNAQLLGKAKAVRAVPALITALDDLLNADVVTEALARIGDKRAVRPLVAILQRSPDVSGSPHDSYGLRMAQAAAAEALGQIGDREAVPALIGALEILSPRVSSAAATALGELRDARAVDALIDALDYEHCTVRNAAAWALGRIGDARASAALAGCLSDPGIRSTVADALNQLGWHPQTAREHTYFWLSQSDWNAIAADWSVCREVLMKDLTGDDPQAIEGAAFALIAAGDDAAIGNLVSALKSHGTESIAQTYWNCGQPGLRRAATYWAIDCGIDFLEFRMETSRLQWGERNLDGLCCRAQW